MFGWYFQCGALDCLVGYDNHDGLGSLISDLFHEDENTSILRDLNVNIIG